MCCVYFIRTEHSSRCDHTDRKFPLLHDTCLYRRSLRTQYNILIDIESILLIFCRMICRNIQFFKIVKVILYFRSFHYFISHTDKDPLYFFQCDRIRMTVSYVVLLRRKSNVDHFCFHLLFTDRFFHFCL